jgi:P-type conjugative transfer ATPase TrbB
MFPELERAMIAMDKAAEITRRDGEVLVMGKAVTVRFSSPSTCCTGGSPRVSAELPGTGERFEGLLPPVVAAPAFAIRKPAVAVFTLDDYVSAGVMPAAQAGALRRAVTGRQNILVAGGTSTGKTTLSNALLAEVARTGDRVVLIEDTRELQCAAPNLVALRTRDGVISLSDLVRSSLRLRPDRIPIGEVRGPEALDLLKAWSAGHPGGIGTIHAGSAAGALRRLEQLIQEAVVTVPRALIAETIDVIAVLSGRGTARRLVELAHVTGLGVSGDYDLSPALTSPEPTGASSCTSHSLASVPGSPQRPSPQAQPHDDPGGLCRRIVDALGRALAAGSSIHRGARRQAHRGHIRRLPSSHPNGLRSQHRLRGFELLSFLLLLRRRSADGRASPRIHRTPPSRAN